MFLKAANEPSTLSKRLELPSEHHCTLTGLLELLYRMVMMNLHLQVCHCTSTCTSFLCLSQSSSFPCSMNASAVSSSSSASAYYWAECDTYDDGGKLGGPSAGLLILFSTYCFEFFVGAPSNLWLTCHILRKRYILSHILV